MTPHQRSRPSSFWQNVAAISLSVAILSFASPQIAFVGHGLRTTLPAMFVAMFAIFMVSTKAFGRAILRFRASFVLGLLFLVQAAFRFAYMDEVSNLWQTFVWNPVIALGILLWIAALAELGPDAIRRFRYWVLLGWCLSLALGLPTLFMQPGVARLTMGNIWASENAAIWAPYGVGEYGVYTSLAICFAPLMSLAMNLTRCLRWLSILLVSLAGVAVLVSTFTMAAVVLLGSLVGALLAWVIEASGVVRLMRTIIVIVPLALLPVLYVQASMYPQTEFMLNKVERLYKGISAEGLAKGDETSRGDWFVQEMRLFADDPFAGSNKWNVNERNHGHSSLSNSLVLFGIFGAGLWFVALWSIFNGCLRYAGKTVERNALVLSWLALVAAGILNPIWHSYVALGTLFAFTMPHVRTIAFHGNRNKGFLVRFKRVKPTVERGQMSQNGSPARNN